MSFTQADILEERINPKTQMRETYVSVNYGKRFFTTWMPYRSLPTSFYSNKYRLDGSKVYVLYDGGYNSAFRGMSVHGEMIISRCYPKYEWSSYRWSPWYELPVLEVIKDNKGRITSIRCKKNVIIHGDINDNFNNNKDLISYFQYPGDGKYVSQIGK
jgi:hypothetical protein